VSSASAVQIPGEEGAGRLRFRRRRISPLADITIRIAVALACLVITAGVVYLERGCYRDGDAVGTLTWLDSFYYATVSLSTTGYGDITPVCPSSRLANILVITPLRFLFLIVLIGTTIEVLTKRTRNELRTYYWRKRVHGHTIIAGFGVKGRAAAKSLVDAGIPRESIVVVAPDRMAVDEATRSGFVGLVGDARREEVLMEASADRASRVVVAADEDDTSVLVTLTARRLAPNARIVAAVRESQNTDVLRQSGADAVIGTAESAGRLMGLSLLAPEAGQIMEDLLDSRRGLDIVERPITREELGLTPAELDASGQLLLAVVRDGQMHRFFDDHIRTLQTGDLLVLITHQGEGGADSPAATRE
jgi:voltage-gated potassium channel